MAAMEPPSPDAPGDKPRIRRKRPLAAKPRQEDTEEWLLSFLDLLTLLTGSFTFMLAFAHFGNEPVGALGKPETVQPACPQPAEPAAGQGATSAAPSPPAAAMPTAEIDPLTIKLASQLREQLKGFGNGPDLSVGVLPGRITLSMREQVLFNMGQSGLVGAAGTLMAQFTPALLSSNFTLSVEGHTDNIPIHNERYDSNWDLAAARAISVVQQLIQLGIPPERLRAVSYGDTQPIADNATEAGRSQNRRVVIVVHVGKAD